MNENRSWKETGDERLGLAKARLGRMDDVMARCVEHRHVLLSFSI
jgi:hypothetical protein